MKSTVNVLFCHFVTRLQSWSTPRVQACMGSTLNCLSVTTRTPKPLATCMLQQRRPMNCLASFTVDYTIWLLLGCDFSPSMVRGVGRIWPFTRLLNWCYLERMFHCTKTGKQLLLNITQTCPFYQTLIGHVFQVQAWAPVAGPACPLLGYWKIIIEQLPVKVTQIHNKCIKQIIE